MVKKPPLAPVEVPPEEVFYGRVSTQDQNPAMQIDAARKRGIPEDNIFIDKASGRTMRRPQFNLAIKLLRPGWTLVVWKLDRLGRNTEGVLKLVRELEDEGINLISLTENLDTRTAMGKAMFHIQAAFAEMESNVTAERTKAGMARLKEQGIKLGRKPVLTMAQFREVEKMLLTRRNPKPIKDIAKKFKVSTSMINNHFPKWRRKTKKERLAWRVDHPLPTR